MKVTDYIKNKLDKLKDDEYMTIIGKNNDRKTKVTNKHHFHLTEDGIIIQNEKYESYILIDEISYIRTNNRSRLSTYKKN